MKKVSDILRADGAHWVGDGFPVRSLFSYGDGADRVSPFLLFDYAGPAVFEPSQHARGVGQHPHRGFETVTIVYDGEVAHRDSAGHGGVIGPGDVQWMTAARGILHEEFHAPGFMRTGGPFRIAQLWVNLPAKDKMAPPAYQAIVDAQIPSVELKDGAGRARIVAGELDGVKGPARTFTPVNVWDVRVKAGSEIVLDVPAGHNTLVAVLAGAVTFADGVDVREAEVALMDRAGDQIALRADGDAMLLVLTGEPLNEPVVGQGPFVMNTREEIMQAMQDFRAGRFG